MTKILCDACGKDTEPGSGHGAREIGMRFRSWWNRRGDVRILQLCGHCGSQAARLLGFCFDTGKILSVARKEQIDGVSVYGPHGGGFGDIAMNGVAGANPPQWHAGNTEALPAAAMVREEAPWMRAQGYDEDFIQKNARLR